MANEYQKNQLSTVNLQHSLALEERMQSHPEEYVRPVHPPMWLLMELDQMPEATVMHLAMGVVKSVSVSKCKHNWATSRGKSPYLAQCMNFSISMHGKYCRIGGCPTATFSALGKVSQVGHRYIPYMVDLDALDVQLP